MKKRKKLLIVLIVLLIPAIGLGYNYFAWNPEGQDSTNQAMTVKGELTVNELVNDQNLVPGDKISGAINLKVDSTATSLLRVKVESYCIAEDGTGRENDVCYIENLGENWVKDGDYYYYKEGVTNSIKDPISFVNGIYFGTEDENKNINLCQGKKVHVNIQAEMVQAKYGVFEQKWGIDSGNSVYNTLKEISDSQNK